MGQFPKGYGKNSIKLRVSPYVRLRRLTQRMYLCFYGGPSKNDESRVLHPHNGNEGHGWETATVVRCVVGYFLWILTWRLLQWNTIVISLHDFLSQNNLCFLAYNKNTIVNAYQAFPRIMNVCVPCLWSYPVGSQIPNYLAS